MNPERVYKDVSAPSAGELAKAVEVAIRQLEEQFEWVAIISVSHDIFTNYNGSWIWTGFITCVVEDER